MTAFFLPAVLFPGQRPLGNNVDPELAIGKNLARFAVRVLQCRHDSLAFHANISRIAVLAAEDMWFKVADDGKAARTGVGACAAVGMVCNHRFSLYRTGTDLVETGTVVVAKLAQMLDQLLGREVLRLDHTVLGDHIALDHALELDRVLPP